MITPRIINIDGKKLVGKYILMSLADNQTGKVWRDFMSRQNEISNRVGPDLVSLQVYDPDYFSDFSPNREFIKWAAVEVSDFDHTPEGLDSIVVVAGLYAVFDYKGPSTDTSIFEYIFGLWLPASGYQLDCRPHFEVLGQNYKNNDPESEEEIWIPVKSDGSSFT